MAKTIRVTPELLEEGADVLNKRKTLHDNSIAEMQFFVDGLLQYWRGEAQNAFAYSFSTKKKKCEEFSEDIERFTRFLESFAWEMRAAEHQVAHLIKPAERLT